MGAISKPLLSSDGPGPDCCWGVPGKVGNAKDDEEEVDESAEDMGFEAREARPVVIDGATGVEEEFAGMLSRASYPLLYLASGSCSGRKAGG